MLQNFTDEMTATPNKSSVGSISTRRLASGGGVLWAVAQTSAASAKDEIADTQERRGVAFGLATPPGTLATAAKGRLRKLVNSPFRVLDS